jgi:hypothetical protein
MTLYLVFFSGKKRGLVLARLARFCWRRLGVHLAMCRQKIIGPSMALIWEGPLTMCWVTVSAGCAQTDRAQ